MQLKPKYARAPLKHAADEHRQEYALVQPTYSKRSNPENEN